MPARTPTRKTKGPARSDSSRKGRPSAQDDKRAALHATLRLIPGYDPFATARTSWLDEDAAQRAIDFFHECLRHIEGAEAGKPFLLQPWQQAVIGNLFGWKKTDRKGRVVRRYREMLLYIPRKNGKTPLAAGICNYLLFCDGEPGAQIYCAAAEKEQAALLYRQAKGMIEQEPELASRAKIYTGYKSVVLLDDPGSVFKVLSADADTKHGGNSHAVLIDELHAQPNRDLVDVLQTSMASDNRAQPLLVHITTADFDRESICNEKHDYAGKVRDGVIDDESFLPVVYEIKLDDDWKDPAVWGRANPNLGISVSLDYLERECKRAQETPTYENTFKRLHLNLKTQNDVRWLSLDRWDACAYLAGPGVAGADAKAWLDRAEQLLRGRRCYAGLDLSSKIDVTASVLVFPPDDEDPLWRVLPRFWVPRDNAEQRERKDRVPYLTWGNQGFITLTDGNVIDYDRVKAQILADAKAFDLQEVSYDPWAATQIALQLQADGASVVEFGQGFRSMSEPTKELEKLVTARQLAHGNNPVLRWMASNVSVEEDAAGNKKPSKKKSTGRIDGIVALVMALGRAICTPDESKSVYEARGIRSF
jgi:phage terminase large subunit-like protein